jgi:cobalt-zinc-cadmium efflux system outer membrane protein
MTDHSTHILWIWIVALAVTFPGALGSAQEPSTGSAPELSLAAAIQAALSRNPRLQATASRVEAAQGRAYQAKLWSNPELELGVEEWSTERDKGFSDSKKTLGIVQELPFPGKKSLDGKIARADVDFRQAELSLRRLELVRDVKAAYFQTLAAERFVAVADGLVDVARSSADAARHRVEAGATSDQEQLRAEIQLEQAKTDLVDFERDLISARQLFAAILGRTDWENAQLTGELADSPQPELLRQDPRAWLAAHPSMAAALAARDRAKLAVRRAGLEPYPNVKVGAAGGRIGA